MEDANIGSKCCGRCGSLDVAPRPKGSRGPPPMCGDCRLTAQAKKRQADSVRAQQQFEAKRMAAVCQCSECGTTKDRSQFGTNSRSGLPLHRCDACRRILSAQARRRGDRTRYERRKASGELASRYEKRDRLRDRQAHRRKWMRARESLTDGYMRDRMARNTVLLPSEIPQSLVDAKRELVRLKQYLKGSIHVKC